MRLCLVASKPTDSVILGFLPAAARLGLEVVLLTDQPEEHERARARRGNWAARAVPARGGGRRARRRWAARPVPRLRCVGCRELICAIAELPAPTRSSRTPTTCRPRPHSRRLTSACQARTGGRRCAPRTSPSCAAGWPRRARSTSRRRGSAPPHPPDGLRYPVVLKPAEGVASEDVVLVASPEELAEQSARILARRPGETLLAEEYLPGELRTLETLGDGSGRGCSAGSAPAFPAALLHRGAAHLGRARARRGAGTRARRARRARRHVRRVPHRVRRRRQGPGADRGQRPADRRTTATSCCPTCSASTSSTSSCASTWANPFRRPPRPWGGTGHAVIDYVVADRSGTLAAVPPAGARPTGAPDGCCRSRRCARRATTSSSPTPTATTLASSARSARTRPPWRCRGRPRRRRAGRSRRRGGDRRPRRCGRSRNRRDLSRTNVAPRVVDTLLREGYGGLSGRVCCHDGRAVLDLPGGRGGRARASTGARRLPCHFRLLRTAGGLPPPR